MPITNSYIKKATSSVKNENMPSLETRYGVRRRQAQILAQSDPITKALLLSLLLNNFGCESLLGPALKYGTVHNRDARL